MNAKETIRLPADCTPMTGEEMQYTSGGAAAETALKVVLAVGGAAVLLVAGSIAARTVLTILGGEGGLDSSIDSSMEAGKDFIGGALSAGQDWLDAMMGQ